MIEPQHRDLFDVLQKQLERMRGMLYGYYAQFFTAVHLFTVLIIAIIGISLLAAFRPLILILPFFVVYAGCFCAFLMSYNIFARLYAKALEEKLNTMLGAQVLVATPMEEAFIYKTGAPKFVAIDFTTPSTAISAVTIQYLFSGAVIFLIGVFRAWQIVPVYTPRFPLLLLYWPLLIVYTGAILAYLCWFFITAVPEKRIEKIVNDAYSLTR
jgi:hypothetical protein